MQIPTILDNLIAQRRVPPMVAVLVGAASGKRDSGLACDQSFAEFWQQN
jgi:enterochelin esterase-like enzyme